MSSSSAKARSNAESNYMMLKAGNNYSAEAPANNSNVAISIGDGWCSFPDLDNFDSTRLLKALTLKEEDSADSIWDPRTFGKDAWSNSKNLSVSALRQLEALFNLSQLLYGLSRGDVVNHTFRDIQLGKAPHSFRRSGFAEIGATSSTRINFYELFEQLSHRIVREGGLAVTMLIYKNPVLPMARQKCLDLISNIATVFNVAYKILEEYDWFIDHLLIMIRDGEFVSDKIPAMCVLIRLLKVILTQRILSEYMKLVDIGFIDCLLDVIEKPLYVQQIDMLPFYVKFEFIAMQSLTVILGDGEYSHFWSDECRMRLINYCLVSILLAVSVNPTRRFNHIAYAEQHSNKHSLAHTILTITELFRFDNGMKTYYFNNKAFKQLIIKLYKKYSAKSVYILKDPGISYALNGLMRELYMTKKSIPGSTSSSSVGNQPGTKRESLKYSATKLVKPEKTIPEDEESGEPRKCSYMTCKNEETPYKPFKECSGCNGKAAYCSSRCKKQHSSYHCKYECDAYKGAAGISSIDVNSRGGGGGVEGLYGTLSDHVPSKKTLMSSQSLRNKANFYDPANGLFAASKPGKESSRRASDTFDHLNRGAGVGVGEQRDDDDDDDGGQQYESLPPMSTNHVSRIAAGGKDGKRRSSLSVEPAQYELDARKSSLAKPAQGTYVKHVGTFKEVKSNFSRRHSGLSSKLPDEHDDFSGESAAQQHIESTHIMFSRPLKTSTAVRLNDLKPKDHSPTPGDFVGKLRSTLDHQQQQDMETSKPSSKNSSKSSSSSLGNSNSNSNTSSGGSSSQAPAKPGGNSQVSRIKSDSLEEDASSSGTMAFSSSSSSSLSQHKAGAAKEDLKKSSSVNITEESEAETKRELAVKTSYNTERGIGGESDVAPEMECSSSNNKSVVQSQFKAEYQWEDIEEQEKLSEEKCMKSLETKMDFIMNVDVDVPMNVYENSDNVLGHRARISREMYVNLGGEGFNMREIYYQNQGHVPGALASRCGDASEPAHLLPSPPSKFCGDDEETESSDDDDDDSDSEKDEATPKPPQVYLKKQLVINNSINSQMIALKDHNSTYQNVIKSTIKKNPFGKLKLRNSESQLKATAAAGEQKSQAKGALDKGGNRVEDFFRAVDFSQLEREQADEIDEFQDDEMSMFSKNDAWLKSNKVTGVLKTFRVPFAKSQAPEDQTPENPMHKIKRMSADAAAAAAAGVYQNNKRSKPTDHRVHPVQSKSGLLKNLQNNEKENKLSPTNSTPIVSADPVVNSGQQQQQPTKRSTLNAQLNLTIEHKANANLNLPSRTLKSASSLQQPGHELIYASVTRNAAKSSDSDSQPRTQLPNIQLTVPDKPVTGSLNISKLMAMESADTTNAFLEVEKTKMPRDLKKSIKEDKSKCVIQ